MDISHKTSTLLKGIGILLIVLHNFVHWLPNAIVENEYSFSIERIQVYWEQIAAGKPFIGMQFLSHYGHYGICIFLFLSGYGLVKKYESGSVANFNVIPFLRQHAIKLWLLMIPAIVMLIVSELYRGGIHHTWVAFLSLLGFVANLIPDRDLLLGPWWFFSLMMQFYCFYAVVLVKNRSMTLLWSITALSLLIQALLQFTECHITLLGRSEPLLQYLRYNFVGHLLPFAMGVAWARRPFHINIPSSVVFIVSLALLITSSLNVWMWFISPVFAVLALLSLSQLLSSLQPLSKTLIWIGSISPFLFAVHPVIRGHVISKASLMINQGNYLMVYCYLLLYLGISIGVAWMLTRVSSKFSEGRNKQIS